MRSQPVTLSRVMRSQPVTLSRVLLLPALVGIWLAGQNAAQQFGANFGQASTDHSLVQCLASSDREALRLALFSGQPSLSCYTTTWNVRNGTNTMQLPRVVLAAIFSYSRLQESTGMCSPVTALPEIRSAVEETETFLLAADLALGKLAQTDPRILHALQGVELRDSCLDGQRVVRQALDITRDSPVGRLACSSTESGSFLEDFYRVLSYTCDNAGQCPASQIRNFTGSGQVAAVVGPKDSFTTGKISPTLSAFRVPHISYGASSSAFDVDPRYPQLFRTAPSQVHLADAIADVMKDFGWNYVIAIGSSDAYVGGAGLQHFRDAVDRLGRNYSIAYENQFGLDQVARIEEILRFIVYGGQTGSRVQLASAVVVFTDAKHGRKLFEILRGMIAYDSQFASALRTRHIVWVASDEWILDAPAMLQLVTVGTHDVIGFVPALPSRFASEEKHFADRLNDHFDRLYLTKETVSRNPWLAVFWEKQRKCRARFVDGNCEYYSGGCCPENETAAQVFNLKRGQYPGMNFAPLWLATKTAVYGIYNALLNNTACGNANGQAHSSVHEAIRRFQSRCHESSDVTDRCAVFNSYHQNITEAAYTLLQLRYSVKRGGRRSGKIDHDLVKIGRWTAAAGLRYECPDSTPQTRSRSCLEWANGTTIVPESMCTRTCQPGQSMLPYLGSDEQPNCWQCYRCPINYYSTDWNSANCTKCPPPMISLPDGSQCHKQTRFVDFTAVFAKAVISLDVLGIFQIVIVVVMYLLWKRHLVMKAAAEFANVAMLLVLLLTYANSIALFFEPSQVFCVSVSISTAGCILAMNTLIIYRTWCVLLLRNRKVNDAPRAERSALEHPTSPYGQVAESAVETISTRKEMKKLRERVEREGGKIDAPVPDSDPGWFQAFCNALKTIYRMWQVLWIGIKKGLRKVCTPCYWLFKISDTGSKKRPLIVMPALFCILMALHGVMQGLSPHDVEYVSPTGMEYHVVCQEKKLFSFVSSGIIVLTLIAMLFASYKAARTTLQYPRFSMPPQKEAGARKSWEQWELSGKVPQEGVLLWLASLTYFCVFVSLLPTFLVAPKYMYTALFALVQASLAQILLLFLFWSRLYKVCSEMTYQQRYWLWRFQRHFKREWLTRWQKHMSDMNARETLIEQFALYYMEKMHFE